MTLTARQRTKINAALSIIYDNGHNAKAVIEAANGLMKRGEDPRSAYEYALNDFIDSEPALTPVIAKVLNLVEASDDKTVDRYDAALSGYLTTGDDSELRSLAPTIAEDSLALALREGEVTQEEAASGDLALALGFEPGEALMEAAAKGQQPQSQQVQVQQFQFGKKQASVALNQAAPTPGWTSGSQVSLGNSPTGMVAPKAAQVWAQEAAARDAVRAEAAQGV